MQEAPERQLVRHDRIDVRQPDQVAAREETDDPPAPPGREKGMFTESGPLTSSRDLARELEHLGGA